VVSNLESDLNPLPIDSVRASIQKSLSRFRARAIIEAPTGSGKSTRVPQYILEGGCAGTGQVVVLQPRRLAARILASRVAFERGVALGSEVGYEVRFERAVSSSTRIRFITEGILLREMLDDPELNGIGTVIFDEFHERHLYGDLCLAILRDLQEQRRPDLKLVVMSATLSAQRLATFLHPCQQIRCEGRTFPVEINYFPASRGLPEPWEAAVEAWRSHCQDSGGHVLIFMPGAYEIDRTLQELRTCSQITDWQLFPLHAQLPSEQQDSALRPGEGRKVIVSTNVAETSLTIEGIEWVIDSGLARVARFDPRRGINTLRIEKISRASAEQRSGRAGRTGPGSCIRLWSREDHAKREKNEEPEIQRVDLAEICLALVGLGVSRPDAFPWLEPPRQDALSRATDLLIDLGAVNDHPDDPGGFQLTPKGKRMGVFPLHPRLSAMMMEAEQRGCPHAVAGIAALAQAGSPFLRSADKRSREKREELFGDDGSSDFFSELRALEFARKNQFRRGTCQALGIHAVTARQAVLLADRFRNFVRSGGPGKAGESGNEIEVRKCILAGFADHVGNRLDGGTLRYQMSHGRRGTLARDSQVRAAEWVVATEITEIERSGGDVDVRLSRITEIEPGWLMECFPAAIKTRTETYFDETTRRVVRREAVCFRDLILNERVEGKPESAEAAVLLANEVMTGRCPLKQWNDSVEQWILRLNRLAQWMPELELQPLGPEEIRSVVEQICFGAFSYKEIKDRPVLPAVRQWLSESQQVALDHYAPERFKLPNNRRLKIRYPKEGPPVLAVSIQDLFEVTRHPSIAGGGVPLLLEILAPNRRPVQITEDLPNFWKTTYPEIKPALSRRYPKHQWW